MKGKTMKLRYIFYGLTSGLHFIGLKIFFDFSSIRLYEQ